MFVVFEGIDGSGKTTISNRVAARLREAGLGVEHVREGGQFASAVTQAIRELGRDSRNLALTARGELLLFAARDAQLLEEATRPALERGLVVLADRFLYTAEVLACHGRGLPAEEVHPVLVAAAQGVTPDLVILVDVDPHVARARRRIAKIVTPDPRPSSRKGLAGVGLQHRMRAGYLELARREPGRWLVVDNTEAELDALCAELAGLVRDAARAGVPAALERTRAVRGGASPAPPAVRDPGEALGALLAWVDRRAAREPGLAAYFLAGLAGGPIDERRRALAERAPEVVAHGLRGLVDPASWALRRALAARAPDEIARSLAGLAGGDDRAHALRAELAPVAPAAVAASLDGRDEDWAWRLRQDPGLAAAAADRIVASVKRLGTPAAWALRERWLAARGGEAALDEPAAARIACDALTGLDDARAWALRKRARAAAPVAALDSVAGLVSERAWTWRARALASAPRVVMRTLDGLDDPRAWSLRQAVAARCKEALDSIDGLDAPEAWDLREACAAIWPSTVYKSLGPLATGARGRALGARLLAGAAGNVSLWKHAAAIELADLTGGDPGGAQAAAREGAA